MWKLTRPLIFAALKSVKDPNIRISVTNTGHDYFARSSVPNTRDQ